jgi:hypothetical protein
LLALLSGKGLARGGGDPRLRRAGGDGSYLALTQPAAGESLLAAQRLWNQVSPIPVWLRDRDDVAGWLDGMELVEPGIVDVDKWRSADGDPEYPDGIPLYGAVGRKP